MEDPQRRQIQRQMDGLCGASSHITSVSYSVREDTYMTSAPMGVPSKADIVIKLSKEGCVNLQTRGEGQSENFADVI